VGRGQLLEQLRRQVERSHPQRLGVALARAGLEAQQRGAQPRRDPTDRPGIGARAQQLLAHAQQVQVGDLGDQQRPRVDLADVHARVTHRHIERARTDGDRADDGALDQAAAQQPALPDLGRQRLDLVALDVRGERHRRLVGAEATQRLEARRRRQAGVGGREHQASASQRGGVDVEGDAPVDERGLGQQTTAAVEQIPAGGDRLLGTAVDGYCELDVNVGHAPLSARHVPLGEASSGPQRTFAAYSWWFFAAA
jgi:hypothetical protein